MMAGPLLRRSWKRNAGSAAFKSSGYVWYLCCRASSRFRSQPERSSRRQGFMALLAGDIIAQRRSVPLRCASILCPWLTLAEPIPAPAPHFHPENRRFEAVPFRGGILAGRRGSENVAFIGNWSGAPGEDRTPDLLVRSQPLYPTELRARCYHVSRWRRPSRCAKPKSSFRLRMPGRGAEC